MDADTEWIDLDGDGVSAEEDCDDNDPTSLSIHGDPECDGFYLHSNWVTVSGLNLDRIGRPFNRWGFVVNSC